MLFNNTMVVNCLWNIVNVMIYTCDYNLETNWLQVLVNYITLPTNSGLFVVKYSVLKNITKLILRLVLNTKFPYLFL